MLTTSLAGIAGLEPHVQTRRRMDVCLQLDLAGGDACIKAHPFKSSGATLEGLEMIRRTRLKNYCRLAYGSLLALCFTLPGHSQEIGRKLVKRVEAQYPSVLKKRGIGGTVRLKLHVKPDGSVKEVEVLGGSAILADSAVAAVKQWRFTEGAESAFDVSIVFDPNSQ